MSFLNVLYYKYNDIYNNKPYIFHLIETSNKKLFNKYIKTIDVNKRCHATNYLFYDNLKNKYLTPLIYAIKLQKIDLIPILINNGADINNFVINKMNNAFTYLIQKYDKFENKDNFQKILILFCKQPNLNINISIYDKKTNKYVSLMNYISNHKMNYLNYFIFLKCIIKNNKNYYNYDDLKSCAMNILNSCFNKGYIVNQINKGYLVNQIINIFRYLYTYNIIDKDFILYNCINLIVYKLTYHKDKQYPHPMPLCNFIHIINTIMNNIETNINIIEYLKKYKMEKYYNFANKSINLNKDFIGNSFIFYIYNNYNNDEDKLLLKDFYNKNITYIPSNNDNDETYNDLIINHLNDMSYSYDGISFNDCVKLLNIKIADTETNKEINKGINTEINKEINTETNNTIEDITHNYIQFKNNLIKNIDKIDNTNNKLSESDSESSNNKSEINKITIYNNPVKYVLISLINIILFIILYLCIIWGYYKYSHL